jgi:nitrogen fixation protein NifU and related proteins
MSLDLRDLYQEVVIDHSRRPRNFRKLERPDRTAQGYNPLCGDEITLYVKFDGPLIQDIAFEGTGCAISKASASMMTASLKGKSRAEAEELFRQFHLLITEGPSESVKRESLGKLAALGGVSEFPARVKCASLAWHTLRSVLEGKEEPISTE